MTYLLRRCAGNGMYRLQQYENMDTSPGFFSAIIDMPPFHLEGKGHKSNLQRLSGRSK